MYECSGTVDPTAIGDETTAHVTAHIHKLAELGKGVVIGPNAVIGPHVQLGDGVKVGAGAIVTGNTVIGKETVVSPYATVGSAPQDLKYAGEDTKLVVGEYNQIREYVNISIGTSDGGGVTSIGNHNLIMVYSHVAHDCHIGNHCVLANSVQLAGHVIVKDHVIFGGMSGAHQFVSFGERVMVGAGSIVVQDVPPFCMVQGDRAKITGLNTIGLNRAGLTAEEINHVKLMYKFVYNEYLTVDAAIQKIEQEIPISEYRKQFTSFLKSCERGICR